MDRIVLNTRCSAGKISFIRETLFSYHSWNHPVSLYAALVSPRILKGMEEVRTRKSCAREMDGELSGRNEPIRSSMNGNNATLLHSSQTSNCAPDVILCCDAVFQNTKAYPMS